MFELHQTNKTHQDEEEKCLQFIANAVGVWNAFHVIR